MESTENKIRLLAAIVGNEQLHPTEDDYSFYLKKDEWTITEVMRLFTTDPEKVCRLYDLIESSLKAGKLKPSRYDRPNQYHNNGEYWYYYDPFTIVHWAIVKGIMIPDILIDWHDQQLKPKQATQLESVQTNQPGIDVSEQSEEKPLTESERTSLLKIILGMAMDSYKYDPDADKNTATGSNTGSIKTALQNYGLDAANKTISKYLREAAKQNPNARPRKS